MKRKQCQLTWRYRVKTKVQNKVDCIGIKHLYARGQVLCKTHTRSKLCNVPLTQYLSEDGMGRIMFKLNLTFGGVFADTRISPFALKLFKVVMQCRPYYTINNFFQTKIES